MHTDSEQYHITYLYRADFPILRKHDCQLVFIVFLANVLDKNVGESSGFFAQLHFAIFAGNETSNEDFLAVQQHSVDLVDGTQGCFFGFEMNKAIAFAFAVGHVGGNFATQNVAESGKGVVHGFVVDGLVQVLDEDVADTGAAEAGITLAPHDPDGFGFQDVKIHGVQSPLSCKIQDFKNQSQKFKKKIVKTKLSQATCHVNKVVFTNFFF